jgi:hypothetical protein
MFSIYGGELEYLHRGLASPTRRRKGNPAPGSITGTTSYSEAYIERRDPPVWGFDVRQTNLLCKKKLLFVWTASR